MNKNLFKAIALLSILFGTMLLAVPVTGPVKTWTSGEILTSADLNSTINSLKAAIEGISTATATSTATSTSTSVSSQWATNGTNISYTNGNVGIGTVTPLGTLAVQGAGTGTGVNFQTANSSGTPLVTALDNGNVGIGTSSPVNILHVKSSGNVLPTWETTGVNTIYHRFIGTDGNPKAYVGIESSAGTGLIGAGSYALSMTTASTNNLVLATNSTARVTVLGSNGNVGIGTSSPTATLSVKGTGTGTGVNFQTANSSGTSLITALDNGNVGIGTSSPVKPLEIVSTTAGSLLVRGDVGYERIEVQSYLDPGIQTGRYRGTYTSKSAVQAGDVLGFYQAGGYDGSSQSMNSGNIAIYAEENFTPTTKGTYIHFNTTSLGTASRTEKMRITANGNVGIGTTAPTEKLEVNGCIKHNNGTLGTSCSSDFRLKKDISNLVFTNVLNKISAMQPKKYKYKTGEPNVYLGLVAQDVEKVAPELVGTNKEGYKTLDYTSIQWMQFQAIKELKAQHDEEKSNNDKMISNLRESNGKFEKENAELKATNEALKKRLDKMERAIAAIEKRM